MGELISLDRERAARRPSPMDPTATITTATITTATITTATNPTAANPAGRRPAAARDPLWREVSGGVLRDERRRQERTLADVAGRAGMSVQHLSEVERGRKEASSEMLAAAAGSLGLSLGEFARRCALTLDAAEARPTGPVLLAV